MPARALKDAPSADDNLYRFSPANNTWTMFPASDAAPASRNTMGFAAAPDGTIYVFGGAITGLALSHGRGPCSCLLLHPTLFRRRT